MSAWSVVEGFVCCGPLETDSSLGLTHDLPGGRHRTTNSWVIAMNKMTKGSLIGAAGLALLTGSFGTYALWTDNGQSASGGVTAGQLDIVAGSPVWDDLSTGTAADWTPATDLVVPGDTITMTQDFTLTATGKNLDAELVFAPGAISSGDATKLTVDANVAVPAGLTVDASNPDRWTFTDFAGTKTVTATVTYTFNASATADSTEGISAAMAASTFTVTQLP